MVLFLLIHARHFKLNIPYEYGKENLHLVFTERQYPYVMPKWTKRATFLILKNRFKLLILKIRFLILEKEFQKEFLS